MRRTCATCLFADKCAEKKPCVHYTPADKDSEDLMIEEEHERERREFDKEWRLYEGRDDNDEE